MPAGGLPQVRTRQHRVLRSTRGRQAVPAGGLLQVRQRQRRVLQGTRGRQAVPAGGLLHVRARRHWVLPRTRRRRTVPAGGLLQVRVNQRGVLCGARNMRPALVLIMGLLWTAFLEAAPRFPGVASKGTRRALLMTKVLSPKAYLATTLQTTGRRNGLLLTCSWPWSRRSCHSQGSATRQQ